MEQTFSILDVAASQGWAMLPERADELINIVLDHAKGIQKSPEILEAYRAKTIENAERAKIRDGVAILDVSGPLFKKANLFVRISGATSYEILRRDLQVALENPSVHSILLKVDSPGGEANGCDELAAAIYEARQKKPITAFVSGMAASGGYWIASAASKVVVSDLAMLGSIGVVLGVQHRVEDPNKPGNKTIEFVSSQSPGKRPDPTTDEGRDRIQTMVDDLAEVFVSAVAKHRGVTPEKVVSDFGAGGIKVGKQAVALGMADEVGQLEATIASLISSGRKSRPQPRSIGGFISMSSETNNGPTAEEIAEKAAADTQNRISTIVGSDLGKKHRPLADHLAFKTKIGVEEANGILSVADAMISESQAKEKPQEGEPDPAKPQGSSADYMKRKTETGALGASEPQNDQPSAEAAKAGWKTAFANVRG